MRDSSFCRKCGRRRVQFLDSSRPPEGPQIADLREEVLAAQAMQDQQLRLHSEQKGAISHLNRKLAEAHDSKSEYMRQCDAYRDEIGSLQARLSAARLTDEQHTDQHQEHRSTIESLQQQLSDLQKVEVECLRKQREDQARLAELERQVLEAEGARQHQLQEHYDHKDTIDALQKQLADRLLMLAEVREAEARSADAYRDEIGSLQGRLSVARSADEQHTNQHKEHRSTIESLEQQLSDLQKLEVECLQKQREDQARVAELEREVLDVEGARQHQLQEHYVQMDTIDALQKQLSDRSHMLSEVREAEALRAADQAQDRDRVLELQQMRDMQVHRHYADRDNIAELEKQLAVAREAEDKAAGMRQADHEHIKELERLVTELRDAQEAHLKKHDEIGERNAELERRAVLLQVEVEQARWAEEQHKQHSRGHQDRAEYFEWIHGRDKAPKLTDKAPLLLGPRRKVEWLALGLMLFAMLAAALLPCLSALTILRDRNYRFWVGYFWPVCVIVSCVSVSFLSAVVGILLFKRSSREYMVFYDIGLFSVFLGILIVPMSLYTSSGLNAISGRLGHGCLNSVPDSITLVDYSTVLYNIRLSPGCKDKPSIEECDGWGENRYTSYLRYLEEQFECGPVCPEAAPLPHAVVAPPLTSVEEWRSGLARTNKYVRGSNGAAAVLQEAWTAGRAPGPGQQSWLGPSAGLTPHMQAQKLFSQGHTRMTCYPVVSIRLQALSTCFGDLLLYEGVGFIIFGLLSNVYRMIQLGCDSRRQAQLRLKT